MSNTWSEKYTYTSYREGKKKKKVGAVSFGVDWGFRGKVSPRRWFLKLRLNGEEVSPGRGVKGAIRG